MAAARPRQHPPSRNSSAASTAGDTTDHSSDRLLGLEIAHHGSQTSGGAPKSFRLQRQITPQPQVPDRLPANNRGQKYS